MRVFRNILRTARIGMLMSGYNLCNGVNVLVIVLSLAIK